MDGYEGRLEVIGDEFWSFVKDVEEKMEFPIKIRRKLGIEEVGRTALLNVVQKNSGREPPFLAMLRETIHLLYEGKDVKIE